VTDGVIVDTGSTDSRIEKNEVNHSGCSGIYMKHAVDVDNAFVKNNITENFENGMVLLNPAKKVLMNNNVPANAPYNYYLRPNSTFNIIRDTFFENTSLRFFDNSSSIFLCGFWLKLLMFEPKSKLLITTAKIY
jgi:hypothetical protein